MKLPLTGAEIYTVTLPACYLFSSQNEIKKSLKHFCGEIDIQIITFNWST